MSVGMSALRGHRSARGRLVAYGAVICTAIGLIYLQMLHTQHCRVEHTQLTGNAPTHSHIYRLIYIYIHISFIQLSEGFWKPTSKYLYIKLLNH